MEGSSVTKSLSALCSYSRTAPRDIFSSLEGTGSCVVHLDARVAAKNSDTFLGDA
jgi:hypothetical protein